MWVAHDMTLFTPHFKKYNLLGCSVLQISVVTGLFTAAANR